MIKWIIAMLLCFVAFCVYVYVDDILGVVLSLGGMISCSSMMALKYRDGGL